MTPVFFSYGAPDGVVWITVHGVTCSTATDAGDGYSTSVYQEDGKMEFCVLRKAADLQRLVFVRVPLGREATQDIVDGDRLVALGDLSAKTDIEVVQLLKASI